jgi:hypothetical protein
MLRRVKSIHLFILQKSRIHNSNNRPYQYMITSSLTRNLNLSRIFVDVYIVIYINYCLYSLQYDRSIESLFTTTRGLSAYKILLCAWSENQRRHSSYGSSRSRSMAVGDVVQQMFHIQQTSATSQQCRLLTFFAPNGRPDASSERRSPRTSPADGLDDDIDCADMTARSFSATVASLAVFSRSH